MNKNINYPYLGNSVIVVDENGNRTEKPLVDNIEQILITENNIEEMKNRLTNLIIDKYNFTKDKMFLQIGMIFSSLASFIFILSLLISSGIVSSLLPLIVSIIVFTLSFKEHKKNKLKLEEITLQQQLLSHNLEKEEKNLDKLKFASKKVKKEYIPIAKKIYTSNMLIDLKYKLRLISDFVNNKNQYKELLLSGTLDMNLMEKGYSNDDIIIIKELIYFDYNEELNKDENVFTKILK